ncbi:hypothetical protein B0H21DRAFT_347922 [Amylocystis lapponica]|nr:hypothetical protein B0H21DRAFT_347922 [Amylocystis lapponica]
MLPRCSTTSTLSLRRFAVCSVPRVSIFVLYYLRKYCLSSQTSFVGRPHETLLSTVRRSARDCISRTTSCSLSSVCCCRRPSYGSLARLMPVGGTRADPLPSTSGLCEVQTCVPHRNCSMSKPSSPPVVHLMMSCTSRGRGMIVIQPCVPCMTL